MKVSSLSRFLAVVIVSFPVAWFYSGVSRRNLNQINANPAGYLEHARSIQHPSFWFQFTLFLFLLGAVVFVVEGLAQLLSRWLPEKRRQDQGQAGTS